MSEIIHHVREYGGINPYDRNDVSPGESSARCDLFIHRWNVPLRPFEAHLIRLQI